MHRLHDTLALMRVSYHRPVGLSIGPIVFPLYSPSDLSRTTLTSFLTDGTIPPNKAKASCKGYFALFSFYCFHFDSKGADPMLTPNLSYANLKESYLFYHIA